MTSYLVPQTTSKQKVYSWVLICLSFFPGYRNWLFLLFFADWTHVCATRTRRWKICARSPTLKFEMRLLWKIRLVRTCSNKNNMWLDARGLNWAAALGRSVPPLSSQHIPEVRPSSVWDSKSEYWNQRVNYVVNTKYFSIIIVTQRWDNPAWNRSKCRIVRHRW